MNISGIKMPQTFLTIISQGTESCISNKNYSHHP